MTILRLRLTLYSFLTLVTTWLLWQALAPLGAQTYTVTPCDRAFTISKLSPPDRVADPQRKEGKCMQDIIGEPAYFNIFTQRAFSQATVHVTYRTHDTPILEVGVLADANKNYHLQPLENARIDALDWPRVTLGEQTLLQRREVYKSVEHFTANPPSAGVRTYHATLPLDHSVATSVAESVPAFRSLRGPYRFYAALPEAGELTFTFTFDDLNDSDDPDPVHIALFYGDTLIEQRELRDERGNENSRERRRAGEITITANGVPAGVYTVAVTATDDIVTTDLTTSAAALSFINRVHLAATDTTVPFTLHTDIPEIAFSTVNPASTQAITVGSTTVDVAEPFRQYTHAAQDVTMRLQLQRDGIIIAGSGVVAFAEDNLFNPAYRSLDRTTDLANVDYILTSYRPQPATDTWRTRSVTFDLTDVLRYEDRYGFLLSAPGLRADDAVDDWVEIGEIKVELKGKSLGEKLKETVVGLFGN